MGYNAEWGVFSASSVGANHERQRIWIVAYSYVPQCKGGSISSRVYQENTNSCDPRWWKDSSGIHRMDDGVAARMDRLKAIGNGQVPSVAANAWTKLINRIHEKQRSS
jgi:DNA (cytosine-5)-methyltransferase 1